MSELPSSAKIVIVGGGIVGCSVAYHLGKMGLTDVLLLERRQAHFAARPGTPPGWSGSCAPAPTSPSCSATPSSSMTGSRRRRGWPPAGSATAACGSPAIAERWTEVKRQATTATSFGLEMHLLSAEGGAGSMAADAGRRRGRRGFPADRRAGLALRHRHVAGQGRAPERRRRSPKGCRCTGDRGRERPRARRRHRRWTDRLRQARDLRRAMVARDRSHGRGQHSARLGAAPISHHRYDRGRDARACRRCAIPTGSPIGRRRSAGWSWAATSPIPSRGPWTGFPTISSSSCSKPIWITSSRCSSSALARVPALQTAGIKQFINGPESFTPDGNFILGEAPEVRGVFVGAGFNAFGIASGGGAGMALAEWVAKGEPPYDLWPVDIRRFGRNHLDTDWVRTRTLEAYAKHYTMAWPFEEYRSGRPLRRSPLYDRLKAQGAVLRREARLGTAELVRRSRERREGRGHLQLRAAELVRRRRPRAQGRPRARRRLRPDLVRQVPAGRPRRRAGAVVDLRQRRREAAGPSRLHADAERARRHRVRPDGRAARRRTEYYIVTGTGFATHDFDWISRATSRRARCPPDRCHLAYAVLSLMGPRSRDVLAAV